jgi:threonylcarbamoyladenosine tRNA methylthiotransferase MtaB
VATYYIESFGCRATQADSAAIERDLLAHGLARCQDAEQASIAVLNTCTVTAAADHDARSAIRRIHRKNPECRIVVTGCYAQRAPQELAAIPGVALVVGNSHKHQLAEIAVPRVPGGFVPLEQLEAQSPMADGGIYVSDIFAHTQLTAAPLFESDSGWERTRPNLKVQDGCDNRCSFCVIPYVRGQSRSLAFGDVLREVNALVEAGYKEVVLSGINLGRWGRDFDGARRRFEDLVRAILDETAVDKLRISSVEPMDWSDELIELCAASPRIARHAHVPLQSGSDRILRRMYRKYRPWHYAERIGKIRAAMPDAAIGADVMVGFPSESDADFEESRRFIAELPFTYLHVFTFSARPGTPAAAMRAQVPGDVTRERNRIFRELAAEKNRKFRGSFVGKTLQAITLAHQPDAYGDTHALTDNYLKLRIRGEHSSNQWVTVRIEELTPEGLLGSAA